MAADYRNVGLLGPPMESRFTRCGFRVHCPAHRGGFSAAFERIDPENGRFRFQLDGDEALFLDKWIGVMRIPDYRELYVFDRLCRESGWFLVASF